MTSRRVSLAFILLSICAPGRADAAQVDFEKQIAPVFAQHCVRCHSSASNKGDVSLATFDDLKSNDYVIAGDPDDSYLIELVTSQDGEPPAMPKEAKPRSLVVSQPLRVVTEKAETTTPALSRHGMAGAVITVLGAAKPGSDREIDAYARNVTAENCTLQQSGKFMWDYGYLWQIAVWPEVYNDAERTLAAKYFPSEYIRGPVSMKQGDDRVYLDNANSLPVSERDYRGQQSLCFYNDDLPSNIVRGRQYFIVESKADFIRIAETIGGTPIRFASNAGADTRLMYPLFHAHLALYAPKGSGPGKGAIDLVGCEDVIVRGCRLSALGDTMHIQKSRDIAFTGNHITGSRMGAFFLAEYCQNAVITGNTVDGSNGSRVMSVEKSCEDVTIVGNTFRNGGRGSWINQPRNFVLADNVFVNNTTKCERDPLRGRRSFLTGDYEEYAELYFTTYEPQGRYSNVTVRGNIFISGDHASHAIKFAPGGDTLLVSDNIFQGKVRTIAPTTGCTNVTIRRNVGAEPPKGKASQ